MKNCPEPLKKGSFRRRGGNRYTMGFFEKIRQGLKKTKDSMAQGLNGVFSNFRKVDEELLDELLEVLIMADVGLETSEKIIEELRKKAKLEKIESADDLKAALREIVAQMMAGEDGNSLQIGSSPSVILVVGVNGVGKTTTIGKLAARLQNEGKSVLICAGDTFRAAAIEQLEIWADRCGTEMVKHREGSDPAAVVFDALQAAKARGKDVVICDTAGRLHNKTHLMDELAKITRVIDRELPGADKEVLLVLDATTGQNAVVQARDFKQIMGVTGVVLTKLDGTARGGVTLSVREVTGVPVKFIGVGEQIDDLQPFDAEAFAAELIDG